MNLKILFIWLVAINVISFAAFGIDKRKAVKEKQRISEKTILLSAFLMGAVGSGAGMLVFHHKTKKWKFRILVPLALAVNLAVICIGIYLIQK